MWNAPGSTTDRSISDRTDIESGRPTPGAAAVISEPWAGTDADLAALLGMQGGLAAVADAARLAGRARLLARAGCPRAAVRDAEAAVAADPTDPLALLTLAELSGAAGHDLACEVVASPFAAPNLRQAALRSVDAEQLPLALLCDLPATLRLTLLQTAATAITLGGVTDDDLPQGLGRAGALRAVDYFLARAPDAAREVSLAAGGAARTVTVTPLPQVPVVAAADAEAPLWIVLPVKDGGAVLEACLASLAAEVADLPGSRVVIVDDRSDLPATARVLRDWADRSGVTVLRTPAPLGFTGAVNLGLGQVGRGPVLLLNADTWLPPGTLRRLLAHLADPTIGTVTPLTNNGGTFSVPAPNTAHAMPDPAACTAIAVQAARRNRGLAVDVPTGNGFCMLIAGACLAATGALSPHYDAGYYEEVDFCLRARMRGFRHVAAVDCFVGHVGSVSFGAAKARLVAANRRRIAARHPGYPAEYLRFALVDPLAPFRDRLTAAAGLAPRAAPEVAGGTAGIGLPPQVLPVDGPRPAWRAVAAPLRAAGVFPVARADLHAAGLRLRAAHRLTGQAGPGPGLRLVDGGGADLADLTPGPGADDMARRLAATLRRALERAADGVSF